MTMRAKACVGVALVLSLGVISERVSVNSSIAEGNTTRSKSTVSADGRLLALESFDGNLVAGLRALPENLSIESSPGLASAKLSEASKRPVAAAPERRGLFFVPNAGQADSRIHYYAKGPGYSLYFTSTEAVFDLLGKAPVRAPLRDGLRAARLISAKQTTPGAVLRLRFLGTNRDVRMSGHGEATGTVNYLLGDDPAKWHTGLSTYPEVVYSELWAGIDMAFRASNGKLKYEFVLKPGARVEDIQLAYAGAERISLDETGNLRILTALGWLTDTQPSSFQEIEARRVPVKSRFLVREMVKGEARYGFEVDGNYDPSRALIIDPGLDYSTFLGGSGEDIPTGIAVDTRGNAYVTGCTDSLDFPTTAGAYNRSLNGTSDVFVSKLDPSGSTLVYSTFLGGSSDECGSAIALDAQGNAYLTGQTRSSDFPTTAGAYDTSHNGGTFDAFVAKLDPAGGTLLYSTYLGGSGVESSNNGIAVDASGSAYVVGSTGSADFPTTPAAYDTSYNEFFDLFVTKLDSTGSHILYSTYLGQGVGSDFGIAVDTSGNAYVTGYTSSSQFPTTVGAYQTTLNGGFDAFVTKLDPTGSALIYSTYLGGSMNDDEGRGIVVDASGNAYIAGQTFSSDFPTTLGAYDRSVHDAGCCPENGFVTKLNPSGSALVYSTYLGGSAEDGAVSIALNSLGNAYVTGSTDSSDFPTTPDAYDTSLNGPSDAFVTKLDSAGAHLVYSTFLGGSNNEFGDDIAVDASGNAYIAGETYAGLTGSSDFPTTEGAYDRSFNGPPVPGNGEDGFVAKLGIGQAPTPAAVVLNPPDAVNPVGTTHTVTATVSNTAEQPSQGVIVRFSVQGSVTASGSCMTDVNGKCSFTYQGPRLPGADLINAYADTNANNTQDPGEPVATPATKAWVLPTSTSGQTTGGGQIFNALRTDKIAFGFNAKSTSTGVKGECSVVDPSSNTTIKCLDATVLVQTGSHGMFFGNATVNGSATTYRIDVDDLAEPGAGKDTFTIQTGSGYGAGGVLSAGNIQVHN